MSKNTATTPAIASLPTIYQDIRRIVIELSEGSDCVVERICDFLFRDLDVLCEYARIYGDDETRDLRKISWSYRSDRHNTPDIAGMYVGFGIGQNFLNFGFLEDVIVSALRKRLTQMDHEYRESKSSTVNTLTGPVHCSGGLYITKEGVYDLNNTYTWFITKRVEEFE